MKKGFTLIELLAVIVILAIIALIATPIILNIIGDTKDLSVVRSGELYLSAVENAIARENLNKEFNPTSCEIQNDGNLSCFDKDNNSINLKIETAGSRPIEGTIALINGKISKVSRMILDGYILVNTGDNKLKNTGKVDDITPQGTYLMTSPSVTNAETTFLDGDINRSQVEKIIIKNTKTVPDNVIGSWDVSAKKDGSIMAWYTDTDNNTLYELYIGGEGGVKANPNSSYLFYQFNKVKEIDVTYLDTSNVTDMSYMFNTSNNLESSDLTNIIGLYRFNTSKVINMNSMFAGCKSLKILNLSSFDTSNVSRMDRMFSMTPGSYDFSSSGHSILSSIIGIENFDTSKVETMEEMFYNCHMLKEIKFKDKIDTSKVITMHYMFGNCGSLTSLDLSDFNTSKVYNMYQMFDGCINLKELDLSSFNTSEVIELGKMFNNCINLEKVIFSDKFVTNKVTSMAWMFTNCNKLKTLDLSNFNTANVTTMLSIFQNCTNLNSVDLRNSTFENVNNFSNMFSNNASLKTIYVKDIDAKEFIEARFLDSSINGVNIEMFE